MKLNATLRVLSVPALLLSVAAAPALASVEKAQTNLVRPLPTVDFDDVQDADARGTLRIDTKTTTGRDRLKLVVKKVSKDQTYTFFMEDPLDLGGPLVQVGTLVKSGSTQKFELNTDKGDVLPFGATAAEELENLLVEVRVGPDVYLRGAVPIFGAEKKNLVGKEKLDLDPSSPDGNCKGEMRVSSKASTGDERIRVLVKELDFESNIYSLWIEDGVTPDVFVQVGTFVKTGKNKGEYERLTKHGAPLTPETDAVNGDFVGLDSGADFVGRELQVRDQLDDVYLSEIVPPLN
jgi:hypothetical protein